LRIVWNSRLCSVICWRARLFCIAVPVFFLACLLVPAGSSAESGPDPRLIAFLEGHATVERQDRSSYFAWIRSDGNPWKPYLQSPFEEGLSPANRAKYVELQTNGRCGAVIEIDRLGFLALYPFLAAAFERQKIRDIFSYDIVSFYSPGYTRCVSLALLKKMDGDVSGDPIRRLPGWLAPGAKYGSLLLDHETQQRYVLFEDLIRLAVCDDYGPAIADIFRFLEPDTGLLISAQTHYYLAERSRHLDLKLPPSTPRSIDLRHTVPEQFRSAIDVAAYRADVGQLEDAIPYWAELCGRHPMSR